MITPTKRIVVGILVAGLVTTFIAGCKCCPKRCSGPVFLEHPQSQIITENLPLILSAEARNPAPDKSEPVTYQWYFAFNPIPNATSKTYTIDHVKTTDAGKYFVLAIGHGTSKSCDAEILVNTPSGDTTGNAGALTVGVSSFQNGGSGTCFPNPPWDKNFPITAGWFLGPNVPPPTPNPFPNNNNVATVTLSTCDPANGTTLQTGIVIVESLNPLKDKVCATNTPFCTDNSALTINQRPMASGKKYKATVVYKSATVGNLQSIKVNWSYPGDP